MFFSYFSLFSCSFDVHVNLLREGAAEVLLLDFVVEFQCLVILAE